MTVIYARRPEETESAGERLGAELRPTDVVYLIGELGSGKTCFARGLARGVGASPSEVASPTFALVHEYSDVRGATLLRHLDLYRLEDRARDLESIGVPDTLAGAPVAIEWPGRAIRALLPSTVEVTIERGQQGERAIRIERSGPAGSP